MPQPLGPYIAVANTMPRHPKIETLSDKAFRLVVESWCYCSEQLTDGRIDAKKWARMSTAKARLELVEAGLAEPLEGGGVQMHDYLAWQWSRAEVLAMKDSKRRGASETNHKRWHIDRGVIDPSCALCPASDEPSGDPGSDEESHQDLDARYTNVTGPLGEQSRAAGRASSQVNPGAGGQTTDRYSDRSSDRSTVATLTSTSKEPSGQVSAAAHLSDATAKTGGGGDVSDDWKTLRKRLEGEGIARRGWSAANDAEASTLLAKHGTDTLLREALAGQRPAVLGGALKRWREIPDEAKHLRTVYRCDDHDTTHYGICAGCRGEMLAGQRCACCFLPWDQCRQDPTAEASMEAAQ